MTAKADDKRSQLLDQAAETYFQSVKSGLRLQEECASRWAKLFQEPKTDNWAERVQEAANQAIPQLKENADQVLKIMEQSTRQSMDLLSKAFDTTQANSINDAQFKLQQLWEASLTALNNSAQTMISMNARLMQDMAEFVKKNARGNAQAAPVSKAA